MCQKKEKRKAGRSKENISSHSLNRLLSIKNPHWKRRSCPANIKQRIRGFNSWVKLLTRRLLYRVWESSIILWKRNKSFWSHRWNIQPLSEYFSLFLHPVGQKHTPSQPDTPANVSQQCYCSQQATVSTAHIITNINVHLASFYDDNCL